MQLRRKCECSKENAQGCRCRNYIHVVVSFIIKFDKGNFTETAISVTKNQIKYFELSSAYFRGQAERVDASLKGLVDNDIEPRGAIDLFDERDKQTLYTLSQQS